MNRDWRAEQLTRQLAKLSLQAAEEAGCPLSELQAAGVGLPGLVNNKTGVVVKTTNMPFYNTPFREMFQEDLKIPVYLGNDADCAAVGEYWAGSAKGCEPRRGGHPGHRHRQRHGQGRQALHRPLAARAWRPDT